MPKLDLTKLSQKYKSNVIFDPKQQFPGKNEIKNLENKSGNNKNTEKEETNPINRENNKLLAEKKNLIYINEKLKEKLKKYQQLFKDFKEKFVKISKKYKLALNKIEILEAPVKKRISNPTTDETVNKRNFNNTSMVFLFLNRMRIQV